MKTFKVSFLFLLQLILIYTAGAQISKKQDSVGYYYYKILDPQNYNEFNRALQFYLKTVDEALVSKDTLKAIENLRLIAIGQT
jgi:hypothetical protein